MFPFTNFPEDFPWPEYSSAKKLNLFFLANFKKALGFFPKVDKTTTITDIEKQVKPKVVNYLGLYVDQFLIEKANNKNRS